jgi:hypothetical protein
MKALEIRPRQQFLDLGVQHPLEEKSGIVMSEMASLAGHTSEPDQFFYKEYCTSLSIHLWRGLNS